MQDFAENGDLGALPSTDAAEKGPIGIW